VDAQVKDTVKSILLNEVVKLKTGDNIVDAPSVLQAAIETQVKREAEKITKARSKWSKRHEIEDTFWNLVLTTVKAKFRETLGHSHWSDSPCNVCTRGVQYHPTA
jgi:hypothetical protein